MKISVAVLCQVKKREGIKLNLDLKIQHFKNHANNMEKLKRRIEELEAEKNKLEQELKEIGEKYATGHVATKYIKCSNPNCRCHRDPNYRHGPYYYLVVNGKWIYLGKDANDEVKKRERARELKKRISQINRELNEILKWW